MAQRYEIDDEQINRVMGRLRVIDEAREDLKGGSTDPKHFERMQHAADTIYELLNKEVKKKPIAEK